MNSLDLLSEIVIQTLREFSMEKRTLNAGNLREALSEKRELSSLLSPSENGDSDGRQVAVQPPKNKPKRISLDPTSPAEKSISTNLPLIRDALSGILAALGPIAKEEHARRQTSLEEGIEGSEALEDLAEQGENLAVLAKLLVGHAVEQIDYANDFLEDLSKDLSGMENNLVSCQTHNRETFARNDEFQNSILTHTREMNQAVDSTTGIEDTRSFISSKISMIGKAIEAKRLEDEVRLREADSRIAELQNSVRTYNEEVLQVRERASALEKEVLLDPLTNIHNRRAYDLEIRDCLRRFHRDGQPFSLIMADVDRFKGINDKYGHSAGDKCLQEIAKLVKLSLRKTDFFARYGGEEFVAILRGTAAEDAQKIAEKIRGRVEKARFLYHNEKMPITISLGVTQVQPTDRDSETSFIRVDNAMYLAKKDGRNRVCLI